MNSDALGARLGSRRFHPRNILDTLASCAVIALAVAIIWDKSSGTSRVERRPAPHKPPTELQSLTDAPIIGDLHAKLALIEYSDFQCSFCARFAAEVLPQLQRKYISQGKVMLAFRHLPLEAIHPFAAEAAIAAACAGKQGQFWTVHDELFRNQAMLGKVRVTDMIGRVPLDMSAWRRCTENDGRETLKNEVAAAKALGLATTPIFLVGRVRTDGLVKVSEVIAGARPFSEFEQVIERLGRLN